MFLVLAFNHFRIILTLINFLHKYFSFTNKLLLIHFLNSIILIIYLKLISLLFQYFFIFIQLHFFFFKLINYALSTFIFLFLMKFLAYLKYHLLLVFFYSLFLNPIKPISKVLPNMTYLQFQLYFIKS